ncbi:MAG: AsmA family protein, partial [Rhodospirillaceae bacterium]|nr:AsmA family protein [Rhodospirillaceae bacterium]
MKKWIRIFVILIVAVIAIGVGGAAILVAVDKNEIRDLLSAEVKKATGRTLAIKGDLHLAISLSPTVIANDVTFANAAWGSSPSMVSLKRLEVGLNLIPLLKGEIDFTNIQLVAPKILLERRAEEKSSKLGAAPVIPRIEKLDIQDASFIFRDQGQDIEVTVKRLALDGEDPSGLL